VRSLASNSFDAIFYCIPQLVQAIRYDRFGYVTDHIKLLASNSQLAAHQLIWNIQSNKFTRVENGEKEFYDKLVKLLESLIDSLSGPAKAFYQREFDFLHNITEISDKISRFPKEKPSEPRSQRKEACIEELSKIVFQPGCYLPCNPEALIVKIDCKSGTPMQSAAKSPFLVRFEV